MSKYEPLTRHLASRRDPRIAMRFAEIEQLLGFPLPRSARMHRPWWANSGHGHVQARGWLDAGYESQDVDLAAERLEFVRLNRNEAPVAPLPPAERLRHPLIGCMAGTIRIAPGFDLTESLAPDWPDELVAKYDRLLGQR